VFFNAQHASCQAQGKYVDSSIPQYLKDRKTGTGFINITIAWISQYSKCWIIGTGSTPLTSSILRE
jgi:hypothetical protein